MTTTGLCTPCAEKVGAWVAELTDLLPQLPDALIPGSSGEGPQVSGSREAPMPVRAGVLSFWGPAAGRDRRYDAVTGLDPVDHRGDPLQVGEEPVGSVLATWARTIAKQRHIHVPGPQPGQLLVRHPMTPYGPETAAQAHHRLAVQARMNASTRGVRTLMALRQFLATHHAWAVQQDWANYYAADLHATWGTCRRLLGVAPLRHHLDGVWCPECSLMALYRDDGGAEVYCDRKVGGCGYAMPEERYALLTKVLVQEQREHLGKAA